MLYVSKKSLIVKKANFRIRLASKLCLLLILVSTYSMAGNQNSRTPSTELAVVTTAATDLYWVSFGGSLDTDPIYVMQIDANGNVTRTPKKVLVASQFGTDNGATALGKHGTSELSLWVFGGHKILYRAVLNKSTLNLVELQQTSVVTVDNDALQARQKGTPKFLAIETTGNVLTAFAVGAGGLPTGTTWLLSPTAPNRDDESSVAADGLAVTTNRNAVGVADKLYFQPLDAGGMPLGSPKLLDSLTDIEANDVTRALANGTRYVVYIVFSSSNKLFLQIVDSVGNKIGTRILLNKPPGRDQDDQNLAIDPLGRFVLFTIGGGSFGCTGHDILVYQALDATGHISGALKPIAKCGLVADDIINIDILRE